MKPTRRWFQYSLRSVLILLTALAVWLGVVVNRARDQREAVEAIEALGGSVRYDWELTRPPGNFMFGVGATNPPGPAWLRSVIGDDSFQHVRFVVFLPIPPTTDADIMKVVPALKRLRGLSQLGLPPSISDETRNRMAAALPNCEVFVLVK